MCVLIFCTTSVRNISHFTKNSARHDHKSYVGLHVNCPLFLSDFNEHRIWKSTQNPSSGSHLFHADSQA